MLETILYLQNPHWDGKSYSGLFERAQLPSLLKKLTLKEIQVLLGIRRGGKSTFFKLIINHLLLSIEPKAILYLNLDDPAYADVWKSAQLLYKVIETAEKLTGVKPHYLFLDEVQNVQEWERFVKSIYDSELFKKIFITGSNSSLLRGNYATLLSGRYVVNLVMPFSFKEILATENIKTSLDLVKEKPKILRIAEQFLLYGGFPEILKTHDVTLKHEQLLNYYDTILLKDCIANHKVRESKKLQALALYLLSNNASLFSYNGLAKIIDSNENTVKEFIHYIENGFLIQEVTQFSFSLKKQLRSRKKSYCIDNGLIYAASLRFSENRGRLLESLVYNELRKMGYTEIYFFHENKECDFIVKMGREIVAIQVTLELTPENHQRETEGLFAAMQALSAKKGYIVTFDSEEILLEENVAVIPFWKLLYTIPSKVD